MQIGEPLRSILIERPGILRKRSAVIPAYSAHSDASAGALAAIGHPESTQPIVGYRLWQWDDVGLKSLNGERWMPGLPLDVHCSISDTRWCRSKKRSLHFVGGVPEFSCTCGIYASKSLDHLRSTRYWQYGSVHGEVWLWGSVVEHQHGYRAQFAYPKKLFMMSDDLPVSMADIETRIARLSTYGCDLLFLDEHGTTLLWRKCTGLNVSGIELLMRRSCEWYWRKKQSKVPKAGDRIAIQAQGIAIVQSSDSAGVHALLWPSYKIRLRVGEIAWSDVNSRWESVASSLPTSSKNADAKRIYLGDTQQRSKTRWAA
jgi:hypothetical protein